MKYMLQRVVVSAFIISLTAGFGWGSASAPSIDPQAEKVMKAMNAQKKKYQRQH